MKMNTDRFIHPKYPTLSFFRIIGNIFFVFGYAVILFSSVELGIYFRLFGNLISFPFFCRVKMWDMMTLRAFFALIELVKLIEIFLK
jgi:hypothetical protein